MRRALAEAERGRGAVEPNPMVGAVVVRDGRLVAFGHHERFGGPHAHGPAPARAAGLARGAVEPNPMVGAVVVRDGRLVAFGHHERFGGPHAEALALARAGVLARGATLYVTLEPCCHTGKTPPCTEAVLAAGVVRVVAA